MKKIISLMLVLLLVASVAVSSFAEPVVKKVQAAEKTDVDKQIDLLYANLAELSQDSIDGLWNYAITDLDHDGNLELICAICKAPDFKTYAKIFEVGADRDAFVECDMSVAEGEPFVDIMKNSADTFYDKTTDTWYYLFCEDYSESASDYYSVKCSISLKDGYVTPKAYATQHCEMLNGFTVVSFQDMNGKEITPEEFNNAGNAAFNGLEQSGTNFSWFTMKDAQTASVLTDSYKVFLGEKEAENTAKADQNKIYIVDGPVDNSYLRITKNPTSEYHYEGENAVFVASATNATSMTWTFVNPNGGTCSATDFEYKFVQCKVTGANSGTLTVKNLTKSMNGWGAYCTFYANGQTSRSSTAYMYVSSKSDPRPVPTQSPVTKSIGGYVSDYLMSSVTIRLNNGTTVYVDKDICRVPRGQLDYGCSCTCYYEGNTPTSSNITSVEIIGKDDPVYNSTSGTYQDGDNYAVGIYIPIAGETVYVSPSIVSYSGTPYNGAPCTVSYTGNSTPTGGSGGSIYAVSVYGSTYIDPAPNPNPQYDYTWTCDACGTWNREDYYYCASCGASRYGHYNEPEYDDPVIYDPQPITDPVIYDPQPIYDPAPAPISQNDGWFCSNCDQWNDEYDVYCCSCGMSRSGTSFLGDLDG